MPESTNQGLWRIGGMYGSAWRNGIQLAEVVEVNVNVEINRIEVPLVGSTKQGYKPGRESRDGTLSIQKIDTSWEMEVRQFLTQGLAERRRNRGTGRQSLRPFQLQIELDDPDALGYELWQLDGCLLWRMPLGFSITDDILNREYPLTWENERPLAYFTVDPTVIDPVTGNPTVTQVGTYDQAGVVAHPAAP
jgi:hypothetical protein